LEDKPVGGFCLLFGLFPIPRLHFSLFYSIMQTVVTPITGRIMFYKTKEHFSCV
jgi:hypothetical protein